MLIMSWIYSGESLFTILNTSHAISLSLLTSRGSVLVWLSNFLRDEEYSLFIISMLSLEPSRVCLYWQYYKSAKLRGNN